MEEKWELSQQGVEEEIRHPVQQWHAVLPLQLQCKRTPQDQYSSETQGTTAERVFTVEKISATFYI